MCAQLLMLRLASLSMFFRLWPDSVTRDKSPSSRVDRGPSADVRNLMNDERQPQLDGGTDRRHSYDKTKGHGRRETKTPNATRQAPLAAHPLKLKVQEPIPSSKNLNLVQVDKLVQDR